jgi:excisionase family DNA binding protein
MNAAEKIPFTERLTVTVNEACTATGLGRTKIYEAIGDGRLTSTKVDGRRLIHVPSLVALLAPAEHQATAAA